MLFASSRLAVASKGEIFKHARLLPYSHMQSLSHKYVNTTTSTVKPGSGQNKPTYACNIWEADQYHLISLKTPNLPGALTAASRRLSNVFSQRNGTKELVR